MRHRLQFVALLTCIFCFAGGLFGAARADGALPGPSIQVTQPMSTVTPTAQPPVVSGLSGISEDGYRLGSGDKLKVTVYGEDDLSGEFQVDGTGQIQLPLVGQIHAAGLTVREFTADVQKLLGANYLKDPKVSIQIENYRPFYIIGEVNKPGEFPFENNLNVLGAVALAGGFTYRAEDDRVFIRRTGAAKEQAYPASSSTPIYPGDIVRVAERIF